MVACCYYSRSRLHRRRARQSWDFCVHFSNQWETLSKEIFPWVRSVSDGAGALCGHVNFQSAVRLRLLFLFVRSWCLYVLHIKGRNETNEATKRQTKLRLCLPGSWCESTLPHRFDSFLFASWANMQTVIKLGINWNLGKVRLPRINQPLLNHLPALVYVKIKLALHKYVYFATT